MTKLERARLFAYQAHAGQIYSENGESYAFHLEAVLIRCQTCTGCSLDMPQPNALQIYCC
jgi:(p)ppGpp synthase/HD superfamily hydrolase